MESYTRYQPLLHICNTDVCARVGDALRKSTKSCGRLVAAFEAMLLYSLDLNRFMGLCAVYTALLLSFRLAKNSLGGINRCSVVWNAQRRRAAVSYLERSECPAAAMLIKV